MAVQEKVRRGRSPLLRWLAKGLAAEIFSHAPFCRVLCWRLPRSEPKVALTFDDGPNPGHTRDVLDILEKNSLRATFFVLGAAVEENPGIFQDIVDAGHEIGIHGYDHTLHDLPGQIQHTLEIVSRFGVRSRVFRPPFGILDKTTRFWLLRKRMPCVLWSVDARDSLRHERKTALDNHDSFDRIGPGDIVLLHDDNPQCLADLIEITEVLRREKLVGVSISEFLAAA